MLLQKVLPENYTSLLPVEKRDHDDADEAEAEERALETEQVVEEWAEQGTKEGAEATADFEVGDVVFSLLLIIATQKGHGAAIINSISNASEHLENNGHHNNRVLAIDVVQWAKTKHVNALQKKFGQNRSTFWNIWFSIPF